jgi:hypothetical protein
LLGIVTDKPDNEPERAVPGSDANGSLGGGRLEAFDTARTVYSSTRTRRRMSFWQC